ncbi:MAG: sigma-54 dependent transcriptional regulator [candidate division KSB1 bacterium]|nr:sigma-54 dependent transcriptional regulator [candidate division KSB1 bacterium]
MDKSRVGILVVDDEYSVRDALYKWFRDDGYRVDVAADAHEALKKLQESSWDIVLLDIRLPGMDGLELQRRIREIDPNVVVIMITAYASVESAVQALKQGAFDYVTKPIDPDDLEHLVRNAVEQRRLRAENIQLRQKIEELARMDEIIGETPAMKQVFELVRVVAETDSTVLIRGESGTGKELIARAIHGHSRRRYFPIITVNCGAFPETLLESELFGHERGAFTGAQYRRKGKIELADGGTLFLDEIGDIPPKMQVDLLRVIETKEFTRVGGNQVIRSDFRLICATNKDLESEMKAGRFREDLYYRINVFTIYLPPLRERREDIPLLARHFVKRFATTMNKPITEITPEAMEILLAYDWPGNVRELENAIERAMVVGKPPAIRPEDLPFQLGTKADSAVGELESLEAVERSHIEKVLAKTGWNISRAASILQIDRVTLYNKIRKYGLRRPA